ncbi:MAG: zinc-binding dehydrogenase [Alphaproteobacteria bacterium]|nr:zinc-binding dehydrogenase [Alphaproteobacteria bacterium]
MALTGLTALVSVEDTLKLRRGKTILVQGGAGGVAGFAIQLARHIGARLPSAANADDLDYVRAPGADEAIDYAAQDFTRVVSNVDAVFETVGGDVAERSFAVVRPGGRIAFIASGARAPASPRPDVTALRPAVGRDRQHLERIVALVEAGAVRRPEVTMFPLAAAAEAHRIS